MPFEENRANVLAGHCLVTMAPKDGNHSNSQKRQLLFDHIQQYSFDESSFTSQEHKHPKGWKQRLVFQIKRWLDSHREIDEELTQQNNDDYYKKLMEWTPTAVITVALFSVYKLSPRLKRRLWPFVLALVQKPDYHSAVQVSLSLLRSSALQGIITRALIGNSEIIFQDSEKKWKRSRLPRNSPTLQSDLLELLSRGGCSDISSLPETIWSRLSGPLVTALPFVYLGLVYKIFKNIHGDDKNNSKLLDNERQTTRFTDIAGLDPIIGEVRDIVRYLRNPIYYRALGAQPPRGVLLHGPPGSGKTLLAQALAGEGQCDAYITCSGSDFCEMYVGRGAARVRSLFERARSTALQNYKKTAWFPWKNATIQDKNKHSRPPTAIIFIDELDALAKSRSSGDNDERDQTLNQLLTEMDGFPSQASDVTIIVIAATNRADVLDPAILRRFDRQLHVPYPDRQGRRDILKIHARKIHCHVNEIDWELLASHEMTGHFSGSDLRNLTNDAALLAVRDESSSVKQSHLIHAIRRLRAMKVNAITQDGSNLWLLADRNA